jgi:competence protein ComEC
VLTHPHPDHLQGLCRVAETMPIGEFWETGCPGQSEEYRTLKNSLATGNVPIRQISSASLPVEIAGVTCRVLHPHPAPVAMPAAEYDQNEESLVLRLEKGAFSALFTGDIGFASELALLRNPQLLHCTLLKVPHHGSRYSALPAFFRAVSPRLAVISAGFRNSFGLPSREALAELGTLGAAVYRTDLNGTITVVVTESGEYHVTPTLKGHFN